jgi:FtsP/CotA-like multicopper oxidase with cupredoxin domain
MPRIAHLPRRQFLAGLGASLVPVPGPLAAPAAGGGRTDGFRILQARPGSAKLRGADQPATDIWGYDGVVPGPVLRVRRGEEVRVRLTNGLPESTTIHWHGVRVPNPMDGVPHLTQPPVAPGASFDYRFPARDAGTFWYRPDPLASGQLARGLAGALIVDEAEPVTVDRDVVLVIDDWRLGDEGSPGGDRLTANAQSPFDIAVKANERLRLRLINASARGLAVRFGRHAATVVAIDGQPAEPFVARDGVIALAPGNRCDVMTDATLAPGTQAPILADDGRHAVAVARLVYEAAAPVRSAPLPAPAPLPDNPLPARMDFRGAHRLDLPVEDGGPVRVWPLSAASTAPGPPLFSVRRGRTVMLAFPNRTAAAATMHLHGHAFRLLDNLDDGWKPYWHDTLVLVPQRTARIAFVADNPGKWRIGCQRLEPGSTAMGAWFEVT